MFISLGIDCRVKYQIALAHALRTKPGLKTSDFNASLYASHRTAGDPGSFFFDWLVSPLPAVTSCISNDFAGVFDRGDLEITANGVVRNRANGIVFNHAFTKTDGRVLPATIDAEYDVQKSKMQYLADKTMRLLESSQTVVYLRVAGSDGELDGLTDLIATRYPSHRFLVVCLRFVEGAGREFTAMSDRLVTYTIDRTIEKPAHDHWQGDDARWATFFSDFDAYRAATALRGAA